MSKLLTILLLTTITALLITASQHNAYAYNDVYVNWMQIFYQNNYPFLIQFKGAPCQEADTAQQLIDMWNNGYNNWKAETVWTDKAYWSDTTKNGYTASPFILGITSSYDCVVAKLTAKFYVPQTTTLRLGLDSDDASVVYIDGKQILAWLGLHASNYGVKYTTTITLNSGVHTLTAYGNDKYVNFIFALYIYKDGKWKILDSSDLDFLPVTGNPFENIGSITINMTDSTTPIIGEYVSSVSSVPGSAPGMNHDIVLTNWENAHILHLSTFAMGENDHNVPSLDHYMGHLYTIIYVPKSGEYKIGMSSDDAGDVRIDGRVVLGYYGTHATNPNAPQRSTTVYLTRGYHLLEMYYYENTGGSDGRIFIYYNGGWHVLSVNNPLFKLYEPTNYNLILIKFFNEYPIIHFTFKNTSENTTWSNFNEIKTVLERIEVRMY